MLIVAVSILPIFILIIAVPIAPIVHPGICTPARHRYLDLRSGAPHLGLWIDTAALHHHHGAYTPGPHRPVPGRFVFLAVSIAALLISISVTTLVISDLCTHDRPRDRRVDLGTDHQYP